METVGEMLAQAPTQRTRLRPGERPVWVDTTQWGWDANRWLADAIERRLAIDVTVGAALEYAVLLYDLAEMELEAPGERLEAVAHRELEEPRLPPNRELREWCALLGGRQPDLADWDELPEVVLPQRVVQAVPRDRALAEHLDLGLVDAAIDCERVAAARGMTLQAWGLRAALAGLVGR